MNAHDAICFCGFILLVACGLFGIIYVIKKEGDDNDR